MPRRKRELRARKVATSSGRRDTGPSPRARRLVEERAGYCCEVCGVSLHNGTAWTSAYSIHHRRPRAMGGTRDPIANTPANLLLLCGTGTDGCHGRIERERSTAYVYGWLVRQGDDPSRVPLWVWHRPERPVLLTVDGLVEEAETLECNRPINGE